MSLDVRVAVVILCQHRLTFERALKSVLSQTHQNLEIVVVQDGCPKETRPLCYAPHCTNRTCCDVERVATEHPQVKYLKSPQCIGYGKGLLRNFAIANSSAPYIAYLDDDNWWQPEHIESLLSVLHPWDNFAWSGARLWDNGERVGSRINSVPCRNGIDTSELMHHRSLTDRLGGWADRQKAHWPFLRLDQDWELVKRFMSAGYKGYHLDKLTVNYQVNHPTRRYMLKKKLYSFFGADLAPGEELCAE